MDRLYLCETIFWSLLEHSWYRQRCVKSTHIFWHFFSYCHVVFQKLMHTVGNQAEIQLFLGLQECLKLILVQCWWNGKIWFQKLSALTNLLSNIGNLTDRRYSTRILSGVGSVVLGRVEVVTWATIAQRVKFLQKPLFSLDSSAATLGGAFGKRNHWTFHENKSKNQWFEIKWAVLMAALLRPTQ